MITGSRYKTITDHMDDILLLDERALASATSFNSQLEIINRDFNVSLARAISISDDLVDRLTSLNTFPAILDRLIIALQQHIIDSGFNDIGDFLEDSDILVKSNFATRSDYLGYHISQEFIE